MALAILQQSAPVGDKLGFRLQMGGNRYYRLHVGGVETVSDQGVRRMERVARSTQILGPSDGHPGGLLDVVVPRNWFDRKNRHVQLQTFRTADGKGAAWSDLVAVVGFQDDSGDELLPAPRAFAQSLSHSSQAMMPQSYAAAFTYQELSLSRANSLVEVLKGLLPSLLGQAQKALGNVKAQNPQASPVVGAAEKLLGQPQLLELITQLLGSALPLKSGQQSVVGERYSGAMAIPIPIIDALLKAVPALAPVLQSAVQGLTNPQFVDAIGRNSPVTKILDSSTDIIKNVLGLNVDVNTNVEDMTKFGSDMTALLGAMLNRPSVLSQASSVVPRRVVSLSTASQAELNAAGIAFLPAPQVTLSMEFETGDEGRADLASVYFQVGREVRVPLRLATPKPISRAVLVARISRIGGQEVVKKRYVLENLTNGVLPVEVGFSVSELAGVVADDEHTLSLRLLWEGKKGRRLGTAVARVVAFVRPLTYDRVVEGGGTPIPLNDLKRHRAVWHKVWGAGLTKEFRDIEFDCKYFVTLRRGMQASHRLETLSQFEAERSGKQVGKLKSGMEWGLEALNALIPMVSGGAELSREELMALDTPQFAHRFTQVGRLKGDFWGLEGESVALWVYPEVQMTMVVLKEVAVVNDGGQVIRMAERNIEVPLPVSIHFIGAKI